MNIVEPKIWREISPSFIARGNPFPSIAGVNTVKEAKVCGLAYDLDTTSTAKVMTFHPKKPDLK